MGLEVVEVAVEQGLAATEPGMPAVGGGVELVHRPEQAHLVDADLLRQIRERTRLVDVLRDLAAGQGTEQAVLVPEVLVRDEVRGIDGATGHGDAVVAVG